MELENVVYLGDTEMVEKRYDNNYEIITMAGSRLYMETFSKEWADKISLANLKESEIGIWLENEENASLLMTFYDAILQNRDKIRFCSYSCSRKFMKLVCYIYIVYKRYEDLRSVNERADELYRATGNEIDEDLTSYVSFTDERIKSLNKCLEKIIKNRDAASFQKNPKDRRSVEEQIEFLSEIGQTAWNNATEIDYQFFFESVFLKRVSQNEAKVYTTLHAAEYMVKAYDFHRRITEFEGNRSNKERLEDNVNVLDNNSSIWEVMYVILAIWNYLLAKIIEGKDKLSNLEESLLVYQIIFFFNGQCMCPMGSEVFEKVKLACDSMMESAKD